MVDLVERKNGGEFLIGKRVDHLLDGFVRPVLQWLL